MTKKGTLHDPGSSDTPHASSRITIPSNEVGVTLAISEKALTEIDQIREESIKAAQEDLKFSWR